MLAPSQGAGVSSEVAVMSVQVLWSSYSPLSCLDPPTMTLPTHRAQNTWLDHFVGRRPPGHLMRTTDCWVTGLWGGTVLRGGAVS